MGWRLANGYGATGGGTLELAVEARRRETDADPTVPTEHTAAVRVTSRFWPAPSG